MEDMMKFQHAKPTERLGRSNGFARLSRQILDDVGCPDFVYKRVGD